MTVGVLQSCNQACQCLTVLDRLPLVHPDSLWKDSLSQCLTLNDHQHRSYLQTRRLAAPLAYL